MKSLTKKKLIVLALIIAMVTATALIATACQPTQKSAIIILPGIMGSNLIDSATGDPLWAPLSDINMKDFSEDKMIGTVLNVIQRDSVLDLLNIQGEKGALSWLDKMKVKPDGTPNYPNVVAQSLDLDDKPAYPKAAKCGTGEYYEDLYFGLKKAFGDQYEVRMFEYDWRLDNMASAIALEDFIEKNGYTDVTFVAHSMGGVLASTYLARSEQNRASTTRLISLGAPYLGALKALRVPENPLSLIADGFNENTLDSLLQKYLNLGLALVNALLGTDIHITLTDVDLVLEKFNAFVADLPTLYQLLPYEDMVGAYSGDLEGYGIVNVDGVVLDTYDKVMKFLGERDFANQGYLDQMISWQREQYVKQADGTYIHATDLIDTVYYVGTELDTEMQINYDGNGTMIGATSLPLGDGTVSSYSAACGKSLNDPKVKIFPGVSHGDLAIAAQSIQNIINEIKAA